MVKESEHLYSKSERVLLRRSDRLFIVEALHAIDFYK